MIVLSFLASGCAVKRIEDLSIPDPSLSESLSEHLLKKFPETQDSESNWDLYKIYTDYNDGQCNGKPPKRPKVDLDPSYFIEFFAKYGEDKQLYLVHGSQQNLSTDWSIQRPYLFPPNAEIASFDHAVQIVPDGINSRAVRAALDRELNSLVTEYQSKTEETYANIFFFSKTPDLNGVLEAVILSQHQTS